MMNKLIGCTDNRWRRGCLYIVSCGGVVQLGGLVLAGKMLTHDEAGT